MKRNLIKGRENNTLQERQFSLQINSLDQSEWMLHDRCFATVYHAGTLIGSIVYNAVIEMIELYIHLSQKEKSISMPGSLQLCILQCSWNCFKLLPWCGCVWFGSHFQAFCCGVLLLQKETANMPCSNRHGGGISAWNLRAGWVVDINSCYESLPSPAFHKVKNLISAQFLSAMCRGPPGLGALGRKCQQNVSRAFEKSAENMQTI